jgi:hypothetical protein
MIFNSTISKGKTKSVKNSFLYKLFGCQLLLVVIYLLVWKLVQDHGIAVSDKIVVSDHNVNDVEKMYYCDHTKWDFGISLAELIIIAVGAWLAYQTSKLPS